MGRTEFPHLYKMLYGEESWGEELCFGINIYIATPLANIESIRLAGYEAAEVLKQAVQKEFYRTNEKAQDDSKLVLREILSLFSSPIYVEEIPNGYCFKACCFHKPWFVVTTTFGRIKIGWRKSVISIDWKDSIITASGEELFPKESVTRWAHGIHAYGYEKAGEYISALQDKYARVIKV